MKYLHVLFLAILAVSCQQIEIIENPQTGTPLELSIQGVIDQEYQTRANDEGFVDGDRMGVFVVDYEEGLPGKLLTEYNRANNMCYTYCEENGTWKGAGTIYWRDKNTPVDVYGYYPFENVVSSIDAYEFEVKVNQNRKAEGGEMSSYEASDFLWAKTVGAQYGRPVTLTYGHLLAGVQVILEKGEGLTDAEWNKLPKIVTADNTVRMASIDLANGTVSVNGTYDRNVILSDEGTSFRGIVVPQTVEAGKSVIGVTIDGIAYALEKEVPMDYVSGKLHKFTIRVDRRDQSGNFDLSIADQQVVPWENDESSHSFEGRAYVVVHVEEEGTLKASLQSSGVDIPSIKNLKISGKMTTEDFDFMREEMGQLEAINIQDVKLLRCAMEHINGINYHTRDMDDALPINAFKEMNVLHSIILPKTVKYLGSYSLASLHLNSTLVLPESVTNIEGFAFDGSAFDIVLPSKLERLEGCAFYGSLVRGELVLPNTLKYIGGSAFCNVTSFYGNFTLPASLEYLGDWAFQNCGTDLVGDIITPTFMTSIPPMAFRANFKNGTNLHIVDGVTRIEEEAFSGLRFNSSLYLPDGIEYIGNHAFDNSRIKGELHLPSSIKYIGKAAFASSSISGELQIPEGVVVIYESAFANNDGLTELYLPQSVNQIQNRAFEGCNSIRNIFINKNVEYIGDGAFERCSGVSTFKCLADTPPVLGSDPFRYMDFDHAILEVPESAIEKYRNAEGWNKFKYITAYHELAVGLSAVTSLNSGASRSTIVRSEGAWEVISCPDWCTVSPMSADTKEEISITVHELPYGSGDREGQIEYRLKDKDYTTYTTIHQYDSSYEEDVEIVLQKASAGAEDIPVFIVGDGFDAEQIRDGEYLELIEQQMEYFFDIEPYKTYRDYFTVSTAVAHSYESGIGNVVNHKETRFGSVDDCGNFRCDYNKLKEYVISVSDGINHGNLNRSLIILLLNTHQFGGTVYMEEDGTTICFCPLSDDSYPYDQRGLIQHYAGGRGFGKLAQEDTYHYDFMALCCCPACNKTEEYNWAKRHGWYDNVSLSGKMSDVPWSHLIFHEKYNHLVDVYEGGLGHARGVYRSEINSCMNTYIPYYNTISRESIVRRIMNYAGKEYSFDDFVTNDRIEIPE